MVSTARGAEGWLSSGFVWPAGHITTASQDVAEPAAGVIQESPPEVLTPEQETAAIETEPVAEEPPVEVEEVAAMVEEPSAPVAEVVETTSEPPAEVAEAADVAVEQPIEAEEPVVKEAEEVSAETQTEVTEVPDVIVEGAVMEPETTVVYNSVFQNRRGANIRSEPSLDSEVLRTVPEGYPLAVLERQGDWALVEDFRERRAWVYYPLLTEHGTVVVRVAKGNLRNNPGLDGEIVEKLDYGMVLYIVETREDWTRVTDNKGLAGWVHNQVVWP
jgi:SH3-like domain-containing protein